tara:strand:- start:1109 stop:2296 length:1188 start_codon:yes stop_codon:yes gene_type:complete
MKITYGKSVHDNAEIKAVLNVLKTSTQMGKNVRKLEKIVSEMFNKKYGVMTNSASSALMIAFEILNLPKNSEVITPCLNFGTAISALIQNNLKPIFVDIKLNTLCVDEDLIEKKINKKTRAILIPNLIGNCPNWEKLSKIAKKHKLISIEDSADTIGAKYKKQSTGKYSDISITSFYGSHIVNGAGNGGMLCLNNKKLYNKSLLLRSWGRSSSIFKENSESIKNRFNIKLDGIDYDKKFIFETPGYNLEPSEISAAFALEQIKKLKKNYQIRNRNFKIYYEYLKKNTEKFILPDNNSKLHTAWLAFPIIMKEKKNLKRKQLQIFLEKKNIQTRVIFSGNILRQPAFKHLRKYNKVNTFKNSDYIMKNSILVGLHQGLSKDNILKVVKNIDKFIKN